MLARRKKRNVLLMKFNLDSIKRLNHESDKLRSELNKKDKFVIEAETKLETLKKYQHDYENALKTVSISIKRSIAD